MKKTSVFVILTLVLVFCLGIPVAQAAGGEPPVIAVSPQYVSVDGGTNRQIPAYNIDGYNYIKLRSLAYLLNNTARQFSVGYDSAANLITLASGQAYAGQHNDMYVALSYGSASASTVSISLDGRLLILEAYLIDGNNYCRLRDLADALGFGLGYADNIVTIDTGASDAGNAYGPELDFGSIAGLVRDGNYNVLALDEMIGAIDSIDYDQMEEDLEDGIARMAVGLKHLETGQLRSLLGTLEIYTQVSAGGGGPLSVSYGAASYGKADMTYSIVTLESNIQSLEETLEAVISGDLEEDNDDMILQLENAQDQIVMGAETLYITLCGLERCYAAQQLSLASLDRSIAVLEKAYTLGKASELSLLQAKSKRETLLAGMTALTTSIVNYKSQLQLMFGETPDGDLALAPLPVIGDGALAAMDYDADLKSAKRASWALYDAELTLDAADEAYDDAEDAYDEDGLRYKWQIAKHTWQAAQYTYEAAVLSFEQSFGNLYRDAQNYRTQLSAAESVYAYQQRAFTVTETKYLAGNVSENDYLKARDDLAAAQLDYEGAKDSLFLAYHRYRWAVDYGIINS